MRSLVAVVVVAFAGVSAWAQGIEPFRGEAGLYYENSSEGDAETTMIGVGGVAAFESVDPGTGPINEAIFLSRVPQVGFVVGTREVETDILGPTVDADGMEFRITGGYASKDVPIGLDLEYSTGSADGDVLGTDFSLAVTELDLRAGYFAMPNLLVGVTYGVEKGEGEVEGAGTVIEIEDTSIGVGGKWVQEVGNGAAVNVEAGYRSVTREMAGAPDDYESTQVEFGVDFYPNQLIGVGVGFTLVSGEDDDDDVAVIAVRAKLNVGTKLGVSLSYETIDYEDPSADDGKTVTISAVARF